MKWLLRIPTCIVTCLDNCELVAVPFPGFDLSVVTHGARSHGSSRVGL